MTQKITEEPEQEKKTEAEEGEGVRKKPDIGQKIIQARKAAGMTQEELAAAINVSRSAVSNWEAGRRLPDVMTLMELSKLLHFKLDEDIPEQGLHNTSSGAERHLLLKEKADQETGTERTDPSVPEKADQETGAKRTAPFVTVLVILAAAVLVLVLVLVQGNKNNIVSYKAVDGKEYRPADFQTKAEAEEGEPYLKATVTLSTISNGDQQFKQYIFSFNEKNGFPFMIDRVENVVFGNKGKNQQYIYEKEDLEKFGLNTIIEAGGEWNLSGGLPEQEAAEGAGILLTGHDSNGKTLQFMGYQDLK